MLSISIHAARVGCDASELDCRDFANIISIHAARVGCDFRAYAYNYTYFIISIHAARVGCDMLIVLMIKRAGRFQSTQPEWAATLNEWTLRKYILISIHAARVGCDEGRRFLKYLLNNFNPRSPSGLRQNIKV